MNATMKRALAILLAGVTLLTSLTLPIGAAENFSFLPLERSK